MGYLRTNSKKHTKLLTPHFVWKKYPGQTSASGTSTYVVANSSTAYPYDGAQDGDYYVLYKRDFTEQYTWADVDSIAKAGQARDVFKVGDEFCYYGDGQFNVMFVAGFEQDICVSGDKAQITFLSRNVPPRTYKVSNTAVASNSYWSWADCSLRNTCNSTLLNTLPASLQAVIKPVKKSFFLSLGTSYRLSTSEDSIWIPSVGELYTTGTYSFVWGYNDRYSTTCYDIFASGVETAVGFSKAFFGDRVQYWLRSGVKNQATKALYLQTINKHIWYQDANTSTDDTYIVFGFCI